LVCKRGGDPEKFGRVCTRALSTEEKKGQGGLNDQRQIKKTNRGFLANAEKRENHG